MYDEEDSGERMAREAAESQGHRYYPRDEHRGKTEEARKSSETGQLTPEQNLRIWDRMCQEYHQTSIQSFARNLDDWYEKYQGLTGKEGTMILVEKTRYRLIVKAIKSNEDLLALVPNQDTLEKFRN